MLKDYLCVQVCRASESVQSTCSCPPGSIKQAEGLRFPLPLPLPPLYSLLDTFLIHAHTHTHPHTHTPTQTHPPTQTHLLNTHNIKGTIGQYFATMHCPMCGQLTVEGVCGRCKEDPQKVAAVLSAQMTDAERKYHTIQQVCDVYMCSA